MLGDLEPSSTEELIRLRLGDVPAGVIRLIHERSQGNPLFVEEVTRHLVEAGMLRRTEGGVELSRSPDAQDLPLKLESLIAARLDHLTDAARQMARWGAVLGREFSSDLLLSGIAGGAAALAELVERGVLIDLGPRLMFGHALVRDVAYSSILQTHRPVPPPKSGRRAGGPAALPITPELPSTGSEPGRPGAPRAGYRQAARISVGKHARVRSGPALRPMASPSPEAPRVNASRFASSWCATS